MKITNEQINQMIAQEHAGSSEFARNIQFAKNICKICDIGGTVYWAARDLDTRFPPWGNHQFILIIFDNKQSADALAGSYETINGTHFITLGAFEGEKKQERKQQKTCIQKKL